MPNYSFILRSPYKKGASEQLKALKKESDSKKKKRKFGTLLKSQQVPVKLIVGFDRDHRFHCKTDLLIYPSNWDFEKQRMKWQASGSQKFNQRLNNLLEGVQNYYNELMQQDEKPSYDEIKDSIQAFVRDKVKPRFTENKKSVFDVYVEFIERKEKYLNPRTIQKYKTSKSLLEKFINSNYKHFSFDNIDVNFIDKYKGYLLYEAYNQKSKEKNKKGFRDDTVAKYIENLKNFLRWSYERGFHKNIIFQHSQFKAKRDKNLDIVTLTINELKEFYDYGLNDKPSLERVRDVFCFGAFTGQRWSDIVAFRKQDLKDDTWIFESYKTKKETIIPLVGYAAPALDILQKYNFQLPAISNQKFNDFLKLAAEEAELNRIVEINRYQGKKKLTFKKHLYEVISSHMARRTAVSILLNIYNLPVPQVMEITGHSDFKTLKRYIDKDRQALRNNLEQTRSVNELMKVVKTA